MKDHSAWRTVWVCAALLLLFPDARASADFTARIESLGKAEEIVLDGRLEEAAWRRPPAIDQLVQTRPRPAEPTPYATRVWLFKNRTHLFIGVQCEDPNPAQITVSTLKRDSDAIAGDDYVGFVLDPFGQRRLGYFFIVNAGAAMSDGQLTPEKGDTSFDALWDAKVHRTETGWTLEAAIDLRSIQFSRAAAWHFNVTRNVPREQMTLNWSGHTLDSSAFDFLRAGTLEGTEDLNQGLGLRASPYLRADHKIQPENKNKENAGLDARYQLTPQLGATFTYNTDFAEAEVQDLRFNLSRFPLFFPEKRSFFLEDANRFDFSQGLQGTSSVTFYPFYSRQIGLVAGKPVDIRYGGKLSGQQGDWSLAALGVRMADSSVSNKTSLFAGRVSNAINRNLNVGAILTDGDPAGTADNRFTGVDATWRTGTLFGDKNFSASGWYGRSSGDLPSGSPEGWGVNIFYPNDFFYFNAGVHSFGNAFQPALGFLPRPGTRQYQAATGFNFRPNGSLLQFYGTQVAFYQANKQNGQLQTRQVSLRPLLAYTPGGWSAQFDFVSSTELVAGDFPLSNQVVVPAGKYTNEDYQLNFGSPQHLPFKVNLFASTGTFYTGRLDYVFASASWSLFGARLVLGAQTRNAYIKVGGETFPQRVHQVNSEWSFSNQATFTTTYQRITPLDRDAINARLRWILRPGQNLYLVWNQGVDPERINANTGMAVDSQQVILKYVGDFYF